jgi:hypothetical protein
VESAHVAGASSRTRKLAVSATARRGGSAPPPASKASPCGALKSAMFGGAPSTNPDKPEGLPASVDTKPAAET